MTEPDTFADLSPLDDMPAWVRSAIAADGVSFDAVTCWAQLGPARAQVFTPSAVLIIEKR